MSISVSDYVSADATRLSEMIAAGEVSAAELAAVAKDLAQKMQPEINAFVEIFDRPLPGSADGPFAGVPFAIKDLVCHAAGIKNENASRLTQGVVAPDDTELMRRFRAAGLETIGRVTAPEFGYCPVTEAVANGGATRNPWDLTRTPGGSSGGSSAVVAAGIVPVAHGNDGGGSIRIPAACAGTFGIKPSRGRVSLGPDMGDALNGLAIEFVLSRSVRDSAALLDRVGGYNPGDPYRCQQPAEPFATAVQRPPTSLKIAVMTAPWSGAPVAPELVQATEQTAALCRDLGHTVEATHPELNTEQFMQATHTLWTVHLHRWIQAFEKAGLGPASPENLEATTWACYQDGSRATATDLLDALGVMHRVTRDFALFFEDWDVLLTPTVAQLPPKLGTINANDASLSAMDWTESIFAFAAFTPQFNMTGQPGISVPLHRTADMVPLGMQFVGRLGDEYTLLQLAAQLEQAQPWPTVAPLWESVV